MSGTIGTWTEALKVLAADERRRVTEHPAPEDLLAYHLGELGTAERREAFQDHLASCHECARAVLDMAKFPEVLPRAPQRALSESQLADETARLRTRIAEHRQSASLLKPERPVPFRYRVAWPIAAILAFAVVGLSSQVQSLRGLRSRPEANVRAVSLGTLQRGGEAVEETALRFDQGVSSLLLILDYLDSAGRSFDDYVIEVIDEQGQRVWEGHGIRVSSFGNFTLLLPRSFVDAGRFQLVLYGIGADGRERLADYPVRFE